MEALINLICEASSASQAGRSCRELTFTSGVRMTALFQTRSIAVHLKNVGFRAAAITTSMSDLRAKVVCLDPSAWLPELLSE